MQTEKTGTMTADTPAAIGADGGGTNPAAAGTRIAMFAIWNRSLTPTELAMLYDALEAKRFPALP